MFHDKHTENRRQTASGDGEVNIINNILTTR